MELDVRPVHFTSRDQSPVLVDLGTAGRRILIAIGSASVSDTGLGGRV